MIQRRHIGEHLDARLAQLWHKRLGRAHAGDDHFHAMLDADIEIFVNGRAADDEIGADRRCRTIAVAYACTHFR